MGEQHIDRRSVSVERGGHERRLSFFCRAVGVCARFQQALDNGGVSIQACEVQGHDVVTRRGFVVRAGRDESVDEFRVVALCGPVQSRRAIHVRAVDIHVLSDESSCGFRIIILNGLNQSQIRARRQDQEQRQIFHGVLTGPIV